MTVSKSDVICSNAYLSETEKQINATYIASYLMGCGWTLNAVSGILGNIERESTVNPGLWENFDEYDLEVGFGLVQWTPASNLINWCNNNGYNYLDIDSQLRRILYELDNGLQYYATDEYPESFYEFTKSTKSPEYLAMAFLKNYERAGVSAEAERQQNARKWYNFLNGNVTPETPDNPNKPISKSHKMSLILMYQATRRR